MTELLINDFKIEEKLAKNKFGETYLCTKVSTGSLVIVKCLYSPPPPETISIINQINQLKLKQTPLSEYLTLKDKHFIIREYFTGSDLKSVLNTTFQYAHISKRFFIEIFIELLKILNTMHQNGIIHADIKPSNIIIRHKPGLNPKYWNPKDIALIDFERALRIPISGEVPHKGFSMIYSPPEQILKYTELYSPSMDVFSSAVCLLEALTHKKPLYDCNAEIFINLQLTYPIPKPSNINDELFSILQKSFYKERFPHPPRLLAPGEIKKILENGINGRYQSAEVLINNLSDYLKLTPEKNTHWMIRLFKRIFIE